MRRQGDLNGIEEEVGPEEGYQNYEILKRFLEIVFQKPSKEK
jgi:hypothetical protein